MRMCGNLCLRIRYPVRASGFFGSSFLFHTSQATDSSTESANLAIDHSKCYRFYSNKRGRKFFPLLGRLCSGRLCIFTKQM